MKKISQKGFEKLVHKNWLLEFFERLEIEMLADKRVCKLFHFNHTRRHNEFFRKEMNFDTF